MRLLFFLLLMSHLSFAQDAKVSLKKFENSTCDESEDPSRLRTRIVSKSLSGDILTIQIAATATCCVEFVPKATVHNGKLNLDLEETGAPCECGCCYEFVFEVGGITNPELGVLFRGKEIEVSDEKYNTYPVKYELLGSDTVNYVDKYGLHQGIWVNHEKADRYGVYKDDFPVKRVSLFPNGQVQRELMREKVHFRADNKDYYDYGEYNRMTEYFPTGKIKRECYNARQTRWNSYEEGTCKEWNEQGQLVYEGIYKK